MIKTFQRRNLVFYDKFEKLIQNRDTSLTDMINVFQIAILSLTSRLCCRRAQSFPVSDVRVNTKMSAL